MAAPPFSCRDPLVSKPTAERPKPMRFRNTILCLAVALSCLTYGSDMAHGQSPALLEAAKRSVTYYRQGQYSEALLYATEAVRMAEEEFGSDHPFTAGILDNLAQFNLAKGNYADAEPLFRLSLAIREKALGPPESDLGFSGGQSAPERRRASVGSVGAL